MVKRGSEWEGDQNGCGEGADGWVMVSDGSEAATGPSEIQQR